MGHRALRMTGLAMIAALAACAQGDPIDEDGTVFDAIAADAVITLGGTEPFWGIEIQPGTRGQPIALYTTPDNIEGREFAVARFSGNNGLGFSGELDGAAVVIAVTPGECSDGMSDRTYPYIATVSLGETSLHGCGHTSDEPFAGPQSP